VCICKSPRSRLDQAGFAARIRRASASEMKSRRISGGFLLNRRGLSSQRRICFSMNGLIPRSSVSDRFCAARLVTSVGHKKALRAARRKARESIPVSCSACLASNSATSVFDNTSENRRCLRRWGRLNNGGDSAWRWRAFLSFNAISIVMPESAEEISQRPDVQKELQRATGEKRQQIKARGRDKFWFVTHAVVLIGCAVLYFLLVAKVMSLPPTTVDITRRILRGLALIVVILAIARATSVYGLARVEDASTRFTLQRILHLLVGLVIALIAISIFFVNWYAAAAALGIGSIIIGLAIQTPMKSFVAWIYILVRQPYRVGDRIKIGDATGDVIDVGYLDTTLWEFGGQYVSGDHPSGRLIKFPNEKVLDEIVYNYSWPLFPYIWNEIRFQVAYNSNLDFVASTMQKITEEELGEEMMKRVETFRDLLARTPVDELEVRERPRVIFRVGENTWLEAIVRYLVPPREAGRVKTRLIKKLLAALNAAPDKVLFPKGDAR
jgi:small-conductance mechanosensitive channel